MNTREEIRTAYSHVLDVQYPGARISMPALLMMTMRILAAAPVEFACLEIKVREVIKLDAEAGLVYISKGKNGGVCRPYRMTNLSETDFNRMTRGWTQEQIRKLIYDFSVPPVGIKNHPPVNAYIQSQPEPSMMQRFNASVAKDLASKVQTASVKPAINDYTCPCCGNDKVSKALQF
jgi:hypothetical protein